MRMLLVVRVQSFVIFQVCDVVDRVLKSPHADILKEMNPVSTINLPQIMQEY